MAAIREMPTTDENGGRLQMYHGSDEIETAPDEQDVK